MSRPFPARYPGKCAGCGDRFGVDEEVAYAADVLAHADCAEQLDDEREHRRPEPAPCPSCWTVHAGECM